MAALLDVLSRVSTRESVTLRAGGWRGAVSVLLVALSAFATGFWSGLLALGEWALQEHQELTSVAITAVALGVLLAGILFARPSWTRAVAGVLVAVLAVTAGGLVQLLGVTGPSFSERIVALESWGVETVDGRPAVPMGDWIGGSLRASVGSTSSARDVLTVFESRNDGWVVDEASGSAYRPLPWGGYVRLDVSPGGPPGLGWASTIELEVEPAVVLPRL